MSLKDARHQKLGQPRRIDNGDGEAETGTKRDEAYSARQGVNSSGQGLLMQVLARENLIEAWKRVKRNGGSAGVDGRSIEDTQCYLQIHWPQIREALLTGTYRPQPVRRVMIPKSDGGQRELGIPTVLDRLIQQALLQALQWRIDPDFSPFSFGFRPRRSAQQAIMLAQRYVEEGRQVVVDVDLAQFFDRVNHDILMDRLSRQIEDKAVLRLIRRYLEAGIMDGGVKLERDEGTPQGGPLSPLLANIVLDEVDRELMRRGHCFVRYADDCNVYVRSQRAGERVLAGLRRLYAKLHLQVNEGKTDVGRVFGRKFLGFSLILAKQDEVKRAVSGKALQKYKQRLREITRRNGGRSIEQVVERLRAYIQGWKAYFRLAQTPSVFRNLDSWLRHRLRALILGQWRRGTTIYRELRALGASQWVAAAVAAEAKRKWRNSCGVVHAVLTNAYFDRLGVLRLA